MNQTDTRPAELYDFRRPTTLARGHSRILENSYETFARQWGTQLTANIRTRSQVSFDGVAMHTYDEYASGLPATTTMVLCDFGDEASKAVIQFPATAAMSWFSFMMGGTGKIKEVERPFTPLESAMLKKLLDDIVEDIKYSLGQLVETDITVESVSHNSQFAQAAAPGELMIVANFTVQAGGQAAVATFAVPSRILFRKLGDANPVVKGENSKELLAAQISGVPVQVSLQLPSVPVTPADILSLTVGQEILLGYPADRPLNVAVDGEVLARAAAARSGKRLALKITDTKETH